MKNILEGLKCLMLFAIAGISVVFDKLLLHHKYIYLFWIGGNILYGL